MSGGYYSDLLYLRKRKRIGCRNKTAEPRILRMGGQRRSRTDAYPIHGLRRRYPTCSRYYHLERTMARSGTSFCSPYFL
ncbi:hypothetical protein HanPI659440_Chr00c06g0716901 [Helianthus annuus]|nr:hypothetical protein HanPI659440_Chr00c06g0716901 [Helianthus annuus]